MDKKLCFAAAFSLVPCCSVMAETAVENEDVVVVSASRTEQSLWNSPVTMQVVGSEQLRKLSGDSITEALRDIPGVTVTDTGLPGRKQVLIRGEKSDRVLVLIDGQELSYQRLNGAGLLIDSESVERIEVVKGPHSVLYGARAIGGVINFITRKGGEKAIQGNVNAGYDTSASGNYQSGSLYGSANGFDYRISGSRYDYGDRETPDGKLKDTDFGSDSVSGWLGYSWDAHKVGVSLERYELDSKTFITPSMLTFPIVDFSVDIPKLQRKKAGVFYDYAHNGDIWKKFHLDIYQQEISREFRNNMILQPTAMMKIDQKNRVDDEQKTEGGTLQLDFVPFTNDSFIIGAQYQRDRIDQVSLTESTTYMMGTPGPVRFTSSSDKWQQTSWSAFAQNEWQMAENWIWSIGARQYWLESKVINSTTNHTKTSSSDNTLVGATSLRYSGFKDTELRLSYAQGYVYPSLFHQFAQSAAGGKTTYGNPDLKAEYSQNIEFGVRYKGHNWLIDTAVYFSDADDYITTTQCTSSSGNCQGNSGSAFQYYSNADKAQTYGMETQIEYHGWDIVPYLSGNLLKREFHTNGKKTSLTGNPILTGRVGVKNSTYFNHIDLDSDFYVRAAGKSRDHTMLSSADYENKSGWATANLEFNGYMGGERQFRVGLQLNNLLDQRYTTAKESVAASGFHAVFSAGMKF